MSYKSRQKTRAIRATQFKHRDIIAGRFYLTLVVQKTCCASAAGFSTSDVRWCIGTHLGKRCAWSASSAALRFVRGRVLRGSELAGKRLSPARRSGVSNGRTSKHQHHLLLLRFGRNRFEA